MDLSKWQTYDATKEKQDKSENIMMWNEGGREIKKKKREEKKKRIAHWRHTRALIRTCGIIKKTCRDNFKDTKKGHQRS
jgi:hypothetical protein